MKIAFALTLACLTLLSGCVDSGYHPSYIISHTPPEEVEQKECR